MLVCVCVCMRVCVCQALRAAAGSEEEAFCELERRAERCEVGANATHGLLWFFDTVYVHGRCLRRLHGPDIYFFDLDVLIPLNASRARATLAGAGRTRSLARSSCITLGQNLVPFRASLSRQTGGLSRGQPRLWLD